MSLIYRRSILLGFSVFVASGYFGHGPLVLRLIRVIFGIGKFRLIHGRSGLTAGERALSARDVIKITRCAILFVLIAV